MADFESASPAWSLLSSHGLVLGFLIGNPDAPLREVAQSLDLTHRHVARILKDLTDADLVRVRRQGRGAERLVNLDPRWRQVLGADFALDSQGMSPSPKQRIPDSSDAFASFDSRGPVLASTDSTVRMGPEFRSRMVSLREKLNASRLQIEKHVAELNERRDRALAGLARAKRAVDEMTVQDERRKELLQERNSVSTEVR